MKNVIIIVFFVQSALMAQVTVPFTSKEWQFETQDFVCEDHLGKASVLLRKNRAMLTSANFENGIIEYDMAFPPGRAFVGVMFRMQDNENYEEFYVRPHQSGNPDANQYSPVYGSLSAWQLYYGEGYGAPVRYSYNTWMHVKIVISGNYMEVYLDDMEKPILISELKRRTQKGFVGIQNFLSESHFANFTYTPLDKVSLKGKPKSQPPAPEGTITDWQVSDPSSEKSLEALASLSSLTDKSTWTKAKTEETGILNLASIARWSQENNTVFARIIIDSEKDQVKKFVFGFSDRARVYLNDQILYSGEDNFTSRDYRFLGTVGYYDAVYLHLKKGRNEIRIAVSENFGGWGVKGKFEDISGIRFVN